MIFARIDDCESRIRSAYPLVDLVQLLGTQYRDRVRRVARTDDLRNRLCRQVDPPDNRKSRPACEADKFSTRAGVSFKNVTAAQNYVAGNAIAANGEEIRICRRCRVFEV